MTFYLHQWSYKDDETRSMIENPQDRADIVKVAIDAYGGTLHSFFFAVGAFDGIAISEFEDEETALACLMSIVGQGALASLETTVLFSQEQCDAAIEKAASIVSGYKPPSGA
jgi:uncharacterized protein with GYD domain